MTTIEKLKARSELMLKRGAEFELAWVPVGPAESEIHERHVSMRGDFAGEMVSLRLCVPRLRVVYRPKQAL